ncbi:alpha/beta hydrolase [Lentisphaera marina]|uniref:alpha/beta fold hydrolase n=1 Tax=Lentisphaera marina TaxID=1111041 RepID=UPI002366DFE8|nr:alpha/beta hydrolase [Lentisphaera marina]MDD7984836.1 alpha/beta hydrolase [Lentisphaera marina]
MKLIAIPGWACEQSYFDFIPGVKCFDWNFYSKGSQKPEAFLQSEMTEDFIFIAYSLGSLYIDEASSSPFCKGLIILSGFNSFCGQNNEDQKILDSIQEMNLNLKSKPAKVIAEFQTVAGSPVLEHNSYNIAHLAQGLDILKSKITQTELSHLPILLIRGRQDRVLHPKVAMQLARRFPNAEQHCLRNEKHDLSQSTEVHALINKFLEVHNV